MSKNKEVRATSTNAGRIIVCLFAIVAKSHSVKNDDDVYYPEN
jgi:hypothetical protein